MVQVPLQKDEVSVAGIIADFLKIAAQQVLWICRIQV
jgi:hypothetical protein